MKFNYSPSAGLLFRSFDSYKEHSWVPIKANLLTISMEDVKPGRSVCCHSSMLMLHLVDGGTSDCGIDVMVT